jgi:hypothetical protein
MNPETVNLAFEEVRRYHPNAKLLVLNSNLRWQFMGEDFERIIFDPNIDIGILDDIFHEIGGLPAVFEYPG